MNRKILLLAFAAVAFFSSCTTAYKTGQTPDDVYYSPDRPQDEYVRQERREEYRYDDQYDYYEDRYLRMRMRNRYQWNALDDWYRFDNRYNYYAYNSPYLYNPWSPSSYWNYYYNPYCNQPVYYSNPKGASQVVYNRPRTGNLNTYNDQQNLNNTYTSPKGLSGGNRPYTPGTYTNNTNSYNNGSRGSNRSNAGNTLRDIFSGGSNNNNNSGSSSPRTSSGSSAPVRKF